MTVMLIIRPNLSSAVLVNYLRQHVSDLVVVEEQRPAITRSLRMRILKAGLIKSSGQVLFVVVYRLIKWASKNRLKKIMETNNLSKDCYKDLVVRKVESVNDAEFQAWLRNQHSQVVVINGTRILSERTINLINCPILNVHCGITPHYRGVHGGYWALYNNDSKNFGVTVHSVDKGVDTGSILSQRYVTISKFDNISTYPLLQHAAAMPCLTEIVQNILDGKKLYPKTNSMKSKQWFHPTLWTYLYCRFMRGIK